MLVESSPMLLFSLFRSSSTVEEGATTLLLLFSLV